MLTPVSIFHPPTKTDCLTQTIDNLNWILRTHTVERENRMPSSTPHIKCCTTGQAGGSNLGWQTHEKYMNFNPHPGETLHNCKPLKHINRHIATLTFFSFSILTFVQGFYIYQKKKWQSSYSVEFVTLRRQGRSSKLRNGFSCSMSGHTAFCDVGDSISDSKVSIMSVVTLYHERDLSQEPQSNDPLSYLSRHRTMLSHGRMLAYWMNIKT